MSRRGGDDSPMGCLLLGVTAVVLIVFGMFVDAVSTHPVALGIPTLLAMAGAVYGGVTLVRHRNREAARQAEIEVTRSQEIARYHVMKPREFEQALGFLCKRAGCSAVQVVGGSGDLGADVIAIAPDGRKIVIQAKRYGPTTKVGGPDLQRFGGTCFTVHMHMSRWS